VETGVTSWLSRYLRVKIKKANGFNGSLRMQPFQQIEDSRPRLSYACSCGKKMQLDDFANMSPDPC
jgi:hypothetical protein